MCVLKCTFSFFLCKLQKWKLVSENQVAFSEKVKVMKNIFPLIAANNVKKDVLKSEEHILLGITGQS